MTFDLSNAAIFNDTTYVAFKITATDCTIGFHRGGTAYTIGVRVDGGAWWERSADAAYFTDGSTVAFTGGSPGVTHTVEVLTNNAAGGSLVASPFVTSTDAGATLSPVAALQPSTHYATGTSAVDDHSLRDGNWSGWGATAYASSVRLRIAGATGLAVRPAFSGGAYAAIFVDGQPTGVAQHAYDPAYDVTATTPVPVAYASGLDASHVYDVRAFQVGTDNNAYFGIASLFPTGAGALISTAAIAFAGKLGAVGDSITAGSAGTAFANYLIRIAATKNLALADVAVSGSTIGATSAPHIADQVASLPTDCTDVILLGGANDVMQGVSPSDYQAAYASLLASVRTRCPSARLLVLQPISQQGSDLTPYRAAVAAARAAVADGNALLIDPDGGEMAPGGDYSINYLDGTHPNAAGSAIMAARVLAALTPPAPTVAPSIASQTATTATLNANASGGTAPLTYAWGATSGASYSNSAVGTPTATFAHAGTFVLPVTVTDANAATATGSVSVTMTAAQADVEFPSSTATLTVGQTLALVCSAVDQFGQAFTPASPVYSKVSGVGSVSGSTFSAGSTPGTAVVRVTSGGFTSDVTITVTAAPDTTAPTLPIPPVIEAAGTTLTLTYSESVTGVSANDYTLSGGATLSNPTGSGTSRTMTISPAVYAGQTRTLAYAGTATVDGAGNALAMFSVRAVVNNSTMTPPAVNTWPADDDVRAGTTFSIAGVTHTGTLADGGGGLTTEQAGQLAGVDALLAMTTGASTNRKFRATALAEAPADGGTNGNGDVAVDHNTGGADNYRVEVMGVGVDDAVVQAWTSYPTGHIEAQTRTISDGRWAAPLMLNVGTYRLIISKSGAIETINLPLEVAGAD